VESMVFSIFAVLLGLPIAFTQGNRVLTNAVLSFNVDFVIGFRNTAHERFGKAVNYGELLVNTVRNLAQDIYSS